MAFSVKTDNGKHKLSVSATGLISVESRYFGIKTKKDLEFTLTDLRELAKFLNEFVNDEPLKKPVPDKDSLEQA
jgi:hypothetical protein